MLLPVFTPAPANSSLEQRLRSFPLLAHLSPSSWEQLSAKLIAQEIPEGTLLLQQGDDCQALLLVERGDIRVYRQAENGREITLYRVEPGESCVLGTSCVLGGQAYPARAVVDAPCRALIIPAEIFRELFQQDVAVQEYVMDLFSRRMTGLMMLVSEVSFGRMDQRLARFLGEESEKHPGEFHPISLSHEQIALHLGTAREVVSRLLHQFADEGLIKLERRRISLLRTEELQTRGKPQVL